jgi:hypothetical protein
MAKLLQPQGEQTIEVGAYAPASIIAYQKVR